MKPHTKFKILITKINKLFFHYLRKNTKNKINFGVGLNQKGISTFLIIIIVLLVVIIAGVLAVYYFLPANKNQNTNLINVNNQVSNLNVNQNLNNANQNTNLNQNTNTSQAQVIDADQDGLADSYEPVFRANTNSKDTDGDGYSDAIEVFNGYKPYTTGKLFKNDLRQDLVPKPKIISDKDGNYFQGQVVIVLRSGITFEQALNMLISNGLAYIPMMLEGRDLENINSTETVLYPDSFFFPNSHQLQVAVPNGEEKAWVTKLSKEPIVESAKLNIVTTGSNANANVNTNTNVNTNINVNQ